MRDLTLWLLAMFISLYCKEGFSHSFNFFVVTKGMSNFKTAKEDKIFQGATSN